MCEHAEHRTGFKVLLACSAPAACEVLEGVFPTLHLTDVTTVADAAEARAALAATAYDILIAVCPLSDQFGVDFAHEVRAKYDTEILLIVPGDRYEELFHSLFELGIVVTPRPLSAPVLVQSIRSVCIMRERVRGLEENQASLEEKIEELRLVNHAKWLLIDQLKLTEEEAQRFIEKQAMNQRISKRQLARRIIDQYAK